MNSKNSANKDAAEGRQIVGFSLPPALAVEVKMEAARRNLSLKELFGEMWTVYKKNVKPGA